MKKRLLSILLALCLIVQGTIIFSPDILFAAESTTTSTENPNVGSVISGFSVQQITYDTTTKSTNILLTHVKTGAKMLVIQNSDLNRGFAVGFNTPAENDKGTNHIIEHSLLGGSEKYPTNNLIFNVANTTYTSFINAFTMQNMTMFPVCSASEKQLMKLTDIYMDSVYHPLVAKDEKIFQREAWRYELEKSSSAISVTGIVYNEMKGNFGDIQSTAVSYAKKAIFPDTNQGNISGGVPKDILTLTYKEFLKTYKKYYHPSNSIMVLYGDVDYKAFLEMLNSNYLSDYSKKTISIKRQTQTAFSKLKEKTFSFPAAKGTSTKNQAVIDLVFATSDLKKLGITNYAALSLIASILNADTGEFKQALVNSKIAESYSISISSDTYQPVIHFIATNADSSKKKAFYNLVMKELKNTVKNGIDKELIKSVISSMKFQNVLGTEGNVAVNSLMTACLYENIFGDPTIDITSYFTSIEKKLDTKYLENLINKYLVKNKLVCLTATVPKAGLLEKEEAALTKKLKKLKSSMTKKEVAALVKSTSSFNTWNSQETSSDVLSSMRAISGKDIPVEVKDYQVTDTTVNGARFISALADIAEVGEITMNFNESHLSKEELLYLNFYSDMLTYGMPTKNRTESQVLNQQISETYGFNVDVSVNNGNLTGTAAYPSFTLNYTGFSNNYSNTLDLSSDVLLNSDLTKTSTYAARAISYIKADYAATFSDPFSLMAMRAAAKTSKLCQYYNYLNGLDYYQFVISLEKELNSNPKALQTKLEDVRKKAFTKTRLTVGFAGDMASTKAFQTTLPGFLNTLPQMTYANTSYTLPVPADREAFTINSSVQYVLFNSSPLGNGITKTGKHDVLATMLNNLLFIPEIRLKGGAYGAGAQFDFSNYLVYSYRDCDYLNSLNVINNSDEYLTSILPYLTEDILDSYIMSTYAAAAGSSTGELGGATSAIHSRLNNITTADKIKYLNEIKSTSATDIQGFVKDLYTLNEHSNYIVVGSPSVIEAHKDIFDTITALQ
ncbi:insulinase family protein [Anaeromicropila populeti]|uniref:Peptidase M16C associated domain-containing protein n=1 Tax=Anaeromicropila populeti TaxID=37658 RepID=A0A1I6LK05_9FIRM|nr:insulinase family protein [Anaeromicropila populeti]SFS03688.1 hypothetical protein SAMN05661086_03333 [Anaeromicropila populeti]